MLFPSKHIKVSESILGLSGVILSLLKQPQNVDHLWISFSKINNTKKFPAYHTFDNFILGINFLYLIGIIDLDKNGLIYNALN